MQIQVAQLAAGMVKSLLSGGKQAARQDETGAKAASAGAATTSPLALSHFRQILAENDPRSITPREFSDLVQQLHDAGELEPSDLEDLLAIRVQIENQPAGAEGRIDLVAWMRERLAQAEKQSAAGQNGPALDTLRRQASWIDRLDRAHQSATEAPLDMTA